MTHYTQKRAENPRVGGSIPSLATKNPLIFLYLPREHFRPRTLLVMRGSGIAEVYSRGSRDVIVIRTATPRHCRFFPRRRLIRYRSILDTHGVLAG